jgi:hypothetical protein
MVIGFGFVACRTLFTLQQLLEGIGTISGAIHKKAMSWSGNYQDSVTAPLSRAFDNEAVGKDDEDEQDEVRLEIDPSSTVLSAVEKACFFNPKLRDLLMLFSTASKNCPRDTSKPSMQAELAHSAIYITTSQTRHHGEWPSTTSCANPWCQDMMVIHPPNDAWAF